MLALAINWMSVDNLHHPHSGRRARRRLQNVGNGFKPFPTTIMSPQRPILISLALAIFAFVAVPESTNFFEHLVWVVNYYACIV